MKRKEDDRREIFLSSQKLKELQLSRLKWTIEQAKKSPFYKKRLKNVKISNLEEITTLPLTTKRDMKEQVPFGFLAVPKATLARYHESFGTTDEPIPSWLTLKDFKQYVTQINQASVNFCEDDMVLIRFPYAISVPAHIVQEAAIIKGACVIAASSRTLVTPHSRIIKLMKKLKITVFTSLPFEAILLAETAKLMGYNPAKDFKELRAICVAGELLTNKMKERIERLWNVKVYNLYGTTETGNLAATCSEGNLHASSDHFLLEVIDPETQNSLSVGKRGILAVTTLTKEAMPLIRYVVGDYIKLQSSDGCKCGLTTPIVEHFGRVTDLIDFNGKKIWLSELQEVFLSMPEEIIGNFWMIIINNAGLLLKTESLNPDKNVCQKLITKIEKRFKIPFQIELVSEGKLFDRNKLLRVDPVIKPRYLSDWRKDGKHPETLDEILSGYRTFIEK